MIRLLKNEFPCEQVEWRNKSLNGVRQNTFGDLYQQEKWKRKIVEDKSCCYFGIEADLEKEVKYLNSSESGPMYTASELVGYCGLSNIAIDPDHNHRTAEWSLLIGPKYQGHGYATEALKQLIDYGFNNLDLEVIWGEIFEDNEASLRLAEKMGMKREGTLRSRYFKNGKRINSVIVSILKGEWK